MFKKSLLYFLLLSFIITIPLAAQNEEDENNEDDEWDSEWNWDWDDDWWEWERGKPFIEFNYGLGKPKHDKLTNNLAKVGFAELKLGYASFYNFEEDVIDFNERFFFVTKIGTKLQSEKTKLNELENEMWRFGFGRRSGYGYNFGNFKILPYAQNAAVWSQLDMKEFPITVSPLPGFPIPIENFNDTEILNRFNKSFRFGTLTEGGIRFEIGSFLSLNAGYEAAVVFPRHMVWKHLGSLIIETAGLEALDKFIDEVIDSSPAAGPIVNFLLKNGFSYAFYTLKKEKMNWPFNTEAPLTYETFKIGITFTF